MRSTNFLPPNRKASKNILEAGHTGLILKQKEMISFFSDIVPDSFEVGMVDADKTKKKAK